tara:strand:+ start:114 stop:335 length:222 start_codon:yes stop_codon:yes gene_type:complete
MIREEIPEMMAIFKIQHVQPHDLSTGSTGTEPVEQPLFELLGGEAPHVGGFLVELTYGGLWWSFPYLLLTRKG